jgi:hypothetical protein
MNRYPSLLLPLQCEKIMKGLFNAEHDGRVNACPAEYCGKRSEALSELPAVEMNPPPVDSSGFENADAYGAAYQRM